MCEEKSYGIIREQGEFMDPVPLTPEENASVNKADNSGKEEE